nr:MAG TPA: hypothetical protein [Inoviridae sp.]
MINLISHNALKVMLNLRAVYFLNSPKIYT